ncbi:Ig-like domain-containing protein [bacterium]|nr:Ig-like domain-containing protein [candidate division CSSED10-310 bacterium]
MKNLTIMCMSLLLVLSGCSPDNEGGFKDDYQITSISPAFIARNLNYPWGVTFISNTDSDGVGQGSVLSTGNLLVTNRGTFGEWANSVTQIDPHTGNVSIYSDGSKRDRFGDPAVDDPIDVAFQGPFVWIANNAEGLGSVAVTDPNPSKEPNGPTNQPGEPIDGPTGTGVFGSDDFGFIVLSVYPEDGDKEVDINTRIEVEFSQPVDPETIKNDTFKVSVDYSPISPDPKDPVGSFNFSNDYTKVEFVYEELLAEATRYKITLDEDILDYRGFKLDGDQASPGPDDFISYFTTESANPRVTWVSPSDGAIMVPTDTIIEVGFSEPIKESTVTTSSFMLLEPDGSKVGASVDVHPEFMQARLIPEELLEMNVIYTVQVNSRVTDLSGKPLDQIPGGYADPFISTFSTGAGDSNIPYVVSITPENGAQGVDSNAVITAVFSENIDPASRIGEYLLVQSSAGQVPGVTSWPSENTLVFTPSSELRDNLVFAITISDVLTDLAGNHLDGDRDGSPGGNFSSSFSTGWERLYITSSYPTNGAAGISVSTLIYVNFSKPVNPATVSSSSFFLVRDNIPGTHVPASVWVNEGNMGATLKPTSFLEDSDAYTVTVTCDVTDSAGNPLDQEPGLPLDPFVAHFSTGGEDTTPPCVVSLQPENGAESVPITTTVVANMSEPILPSTVNNSTFTLTGQSGAIPSQYAFSNGNATITLIPTIDLTTSETYVVTLTTGISDPSGNGLDGDCNGTAGPNYTSSFTTGEGGVVINEVVVDPQQDWNDSEGGDGIPFNSIPGTGSLTTSDEWIEIYNASNQTFDLTNWILEMVDTTPETHIIGSGSGTEVLYPATSTLSNFTPGSYLIIGNPLGSNNNDCFFVLKNSLGVTVDKVEIGDDPEGDGDGDGAPDSGEDGNADDITNESIARLPNGFDTNVDIDDFVKQAATLGSSNGGKNGTGPFMGMFRSETILLGMSGLAFAGVAPDDPGPYSVLYFASHARRSAVYGIDFDDGVYYAFTGCEWPADVEYVPFYSEQGHPIPGTGYLFAIDPVEGNLARARMKPSGPVGDDQTVSVAETQQEDSPIYLTFPMMSEPTGIAYSQEHDRLYIACRGNGYVLEITPEGVLTEIFDTGFGANGLSGIAVGDMGAGDVLFLSYTGGGRIGQGDGPHGSILTFDPHP